jgi:hypothetical protein
MASPRQAWPPTIPVHRNYLCSPVSQLFSEKLAPIEKLMEARINFGLAADCVSSNDGMNLFHEGRAFNTHKLAGVFIRNNFSYFWINQFYFHLSTMILKLVFIIQLA